eukprot:TRINITY_DN9317_c0_g1_i10.p1 TRINITY_DN9317_c0_g1~~TRINITY_DN9317_c0_g1_i10.p1  ORF type:complete len:109 (-),score=4.92 TRINITY_DN9317_c0_g1_i10:158-484(-)
MAEPAQETLEATTTPSPSASAFPASLDSFRNSCEARGLLGTRWSPSASPTSGQTPNIGRAVAARLERPDLETGVRGLTELVDLEGIFSPRGKESRAGRLSWPPFCSYC